ncbi:hypothetical protein MPH_09288 [Macrophomina phaseolina MS6]|uniref:Uncharacterized protein n=1 Tax=Macrophomina phaseolina (strain MS6) TaxID=1126212 RepID=K2RLB1_MACPH|nr:hypothetical protein MPH_09288 [Macrophomina phaseolina MS6]
MLLLRTLGVAWYVAASAQAAPLVSNFSEQPVIFRGQEMHNLLAFGDSYTYVQGTQGHWNYSFISDAFNYSFTPDQLLSSQIVKNTTSSGGPNWVEYLTGCYEGLPAACPRTKLWDFAFAGADISAEYLPLHHNYTVDLDDQVKQWDLINDINDSDKFTNVSFAAWYEKLVDKWFESVELVYSRGYRNFLFMLPPPLEKTASNLASANPLPNATMMGQWNTAVQSRVSAFRAGHNDSSTFVFDTYTFLNGVLADPAKYSIHNTTGYCQSYGQSDVLWNYAAYGCQPIQQYFWFSKSSARDAAEMERTAAHQLGFTDSGHITFTVHQIIATELLTQLA